MKRIAKYLHIGMLFSMPFFADDGCCTTSCSTSSAGCQEVKTVFVPMSIGTDLSKQYHQINYFDEEKDCSWYFDLDATYSYSRSRKGACIAKMLFGDSKLSFLGQFTSEAAGLDDTKRGAGKLVPEYFGFQRDANFYVNLCPLIQNHKLDLQFAAGGEKFWFQVNAPIVYSKWEINKSCAPTAVGSLGKLGIESGGVNAKFGISTTAKDVTYTGSKTIASFDGVKTTPNIIINDISNDFDASLNSNDIAAFAPKDASQLSKEETMCSWTTLKVDGTNVPLDGSEKIILTNGGTANTVGNTILETANAGAKTVEEGLGGLTFGDFKERNYNLFNFSKSSCKTDWKIADIGLQLGYDFYKCDDKHFGLYIKAIVPTGTDIDAKFAKYVMSPVIGNGKHFELGAGLNGHAELWSCDDNALIVNVDGYLTHMFAKSQFRTFDRTNDPMSRYSVIKEMTKSGKSGDPYIYTQNLRALGDVNSACVDVSADIKGEAVIDLIYSHCNWELGGGYAFSGQTKEKVKDCGACLDNEIMPSFYYGFKGNAYLNNIFFDRDSSSVPTIKVKSAIDVVEGGKNLTMSAYKYGVGVEELGSPAGAAGRDPNDNDVFTLPDFNRSGLMEGQMLHRLFGHIDYIWSDNCWAPQLGIVGSFGFSPNSYKTAEYWDVGARLGFSY